MGGSGDHIEHGGVGWSYLLRHLLGQGLELAAVRVLILVLKHLVGDAHGPGVHPLLTPVLADCRPTDTWG